jgi:OOP family OmpA-OmpF porin
MTKHYLKAVFFVMVSALLIGCAIQKPQTAFNAHDLTPKLQAGRYTQKVDHFMVVLDASASMREPYKSQTKLKLAKDVVCRMNQTIPDVPLTGALRTFGQSAWPFSKKTTLIWGLTKYTKEGLEGALKTVKWTGGKSPLALAIDAASEDLKPTHGNTAVIIVSDGKETGNAPVVAAENMKSLFGDRLCIYTVLVANDPAGKCLMERVARAGHCGFSVNAGQIACSKSMANFVEKVFLEKAEAMDSDGDGVLNDLDKCPNTPRGVKVDRFGCPIDTDGDGVYDNLDRCPNTPKRAKVDRMGCPLDSDGDGVYDYLDQCPNTPSGVRVDREGCPPDSDGDGVPDHMDECPDTPKGATVNSVGCWALKGVALFDHNKWELKPEACPLLDEVVTILKKNRGIEGEIQGHTDSTGPEAYNQRLSEKRAQAVVDYLVQHGIDPGRFTVRGYGESRPMASNDTKEGRQENRRVELKRIR